MQMFATNLKTKMAKARAITAQVVERAADTFTFWVVLFALLAFSLWLASPPWLTAMHSTIGGVPNALYELMEFAEKDAFLSTILAIVRHPLTAVALWLYLAYLWIKDERAAAARLSTTQRLAPLTAADRVHLFSHRLGMVLALLLFLPVILLGPTSLAVAIVWSVGTGFVYLAVRVIGLVIAALFE